MERLGGHMYPPRKFVNIQLNQMHDCLYALHDIDSIKLNSDTNFIFSELIEWMERLDYQLDSRLVKNYKVRYN